MSSEIQLEAEKCIELERKPHLESINYLLSKKPIYWAYCSNGKYHLDRVLVFQK